MSDGAISDSKRLWRILQRRTTLFEESETKDQRSDTATLKVWTWVQDDSSLISAAEILHDQIMVRPPHIWTAATSSNVSTHTTAIPLEPILTWGIVSVIATRLADEGKNHAEGYQSMLPWHLHEVLIDANLSLSTFLQYFCSLFDRVVLDPCLRETVTNTREQFILVTLLYGKYEFFWSLMTENATSKGKEEQERQDLLFKAGWLTFLIAKRKASVEYTGLGQLYLLLVASVHLVITKLRNSSVEAEVVAALSSLGTCPTDPYKISNQTNRGLVKGYTPCVDSELSEAQTEKDVLACLCASPKVDIKAVERASQQLEFIVLELKSQEILRSPKSELDALNPILAVFENQVLPNNVHNLSEFYMKMYLGKASTLDERFYLDALARAVLLPKRSSSRVEANAGTTEPRNVKMTDSQWESPRQVRAPARSGRPPTSPMPSVASQGQGWYSPPPVCNRTGTSTPGARSSTIFSSPLHPAQTPITAAVEINNWIRVNMSNSYHPDNPVFERLHHYFGKCSTDGDDGSDPSIYIAEILETLIGKLFNARKSQWTSSRRRSIDLTRSLEKLSPSRKQRKLNTGDSSSIQSEESSQSYADQTYSEVDGGLLKKKEYAKTLFYHVLQSMLIAEEARLQTSNFTWLLRNNVFLSAMFACSLEVILKAHSLITLSFPFLLEHLEVNVFDFGLLLESFVKHVPKRLPCALKRHLRDIEQMIMASMAWESSSGLYRALASVSHKGEEAQVTGDHTQSIHTLDASCPSPALVRPAVSPEGTEGKRSDLTSRHITITSHGLHVFFRKVFALAASRIYRLGTMLGLEPKILNQVWTAVKECLTYHHELVKDRHVDHIILCSLYGVCKVNLIKPEVTFRRVIEVYKKLQTPHWAIHRPGTTGSTASDIIRHIRLVDASTSSKSSTAPRESVPRGDIIKFYNKCFIAAMKVFLLQFQLQDKQEKMADAVIVDHSLPLIRSMNEDGSRESASTCDADVVAEAAATAVQMVMLGKVKTTDTTQMRELTAPGSPERNCVMKAASIEALPVSVQHSSPQRVPSSNVYMSPLQQSRLQHHRNRMTPRSHALYAFGESPARDLALINRAVNPVVRSASTKVSKSRET
uniref:Uncharacterized protein AlNc14C100G6011 n=1 Tax=Albugo laibachii Nc14 TaxID=890382 RepID=F0WHE8_9STRA|nr:conserved hypothetical protein [Albugo laibachii Nc14]|eukprot:CCA20667.1 conserved hypothetical protein [Albugo laibachii Nc14]